MQGMDVGAPIQQQPDDLAGRRGHRPVQRRAPRAIAAVHELRVGVEKRPHAREIAGGRRDVDRVIGRGVGRRDPAAVAMQAGLLEQPGDRLVAPIPGDGDQVVADDRHRGRVRARIEQHPHGLEMPFAHGEVDRLSVPVLRPVQVGIALEQATQRRRVAGGRGADRVPDVAPAARPWPVREFGSRVRPA